MITNHTDNPTGYKLRHGIALLLLRITFGGLMMTHGFDKMSHYSAMKLGFPDPLHVSPAISLSLTIFAEFFCSLLLIIGLFSKKALVPLMFCMSMATFVINHGKSLIQHELAPHYLVVFIAIYLFGPGMYSMDWLIARRRQARGTLKHPPLIPQ